MLFRLPSLHVVRFISYNVTCRGAKTVSATPKKQNKGDTSATKMSKKIPDRWLDYRSVGKRIPGTRFIAFKVPLKQSLNNRVPEADVFGPWELLDALEKEKQELGLIIDLTFTSRYYNLQDVPESLFCVKIFTAGHEIPTDATILTFKRAVRRFLRDNADNDKLIGVHCTHGLNRTGYLVCRYLIDVNGMDPKKAVELFNSSRGHSIERENYLKDLQSGPKRSNKGMEESELEPMRGRAVERPRYTAFVSNPTENRQPYGQDRQHYRPSNHGGWNQQSHRQRPEPNHGGWNQHSHRQHPETSYHPPPLLPQPPFPSHIRFDPYYGDQGRYEPPYPGQRSFSHPGGERRGGGGGSYPSAPSFPVLPYYPSGAFDSHEPYYQDPSDVPKRKSRHRPSRKYRHKN